MTRARALAIVVLLVAGLLVTTATGSSSGSSEKDTSSGGPKAVQAPGSSDATKDVSVVGCGADSTTQFATATLKVLNNSSKPSNYFINVSFESSDGTTQLGTGIASVDHLAPGQATQVTASDLQAATGQFTCKITEVTRFAA